MREKNWELGVLGPGSRKWVLGVLFIYLFLILRSGSKRRRFTNNPFSRSETWCFKSSQASQKERSASFAYDGVLREKRENNRHNNNNNNNGSKISDSSPTHALLCSSNQAEPEASQLFFLFVFRCRRSLFFILIFISVPRCCCDDWYMCSSTLSPSLLCLCLKIFVFDGLPGFSISVYGFFFLVLNLGSLWSFSNSLGSKNFVVCFICMQRKWR